MFFMWDFVIILLSCQSALYILSRSPNHLCDLQIFSPILFVVFSHPCGEKPTTLLFCLCPLCLWQSQSPCAALPDALISLPPPTRLCLELGSTHIAFYFLRLGGGDLVCFSRDTTTSFPKNKESLWRHCNFPASGPKFTTEIQERVFCLFHLPKSLWNAGRSHRSEVFLASKQQLWDGPRHIVPLHSWGYI